MKRFAPLVARYWMPLLKGRHFDWEIVLLLVPEFQTPLSRSGGHDRRAGPVGGSLRRDEIYIMGAW